MINAFWLKIAFKNGILVLMPVIEYLFNAQGVMTKYNTPEDILKEYCTYRLNHYDTRKKYFISESENELIKIKERIRFIGYELDDNHELEVKGSKKKEIIDMLEKYKFVKFSSSRKTKDKNKNVKDEDEDTEEDDGNAIDNVDENLNFNYLLNMPIWSLTRERIDKLEREREALQIKLDNIKGISIQQLWYTDLDEYKKLMTIFEDRWCDEDHYKDVLKTPQGIVDIPSNLKTKIFVKSKTAKITIKLKCEPI